MSEVRWDLIGQFPNAGQAFQQSFQQGQQSQRENVGRAAMAALVQDPNNPRALQALASVDPQAAQQFQQQRLQMWQQQHAQHMDAIQKGGQIIRQVKDENPNLPDDQVYARAYQIAGQAGLDLREVPPPGDPRAIEYMHGMLSLANTFSPPQNDVQLIPYQAGGGVIAHNKRTGANEQLVVPNPGDQQAGAPVNAQPLTDADIARLRGGQSPQGSGNF